MKNPKASPAYCRPDIAQGLLDNRPLPYSLRLLSEACGLSLEEQISFLRERCDWSMTTQAFKENILLSDRVAVRGKESRKIDKELSRKLITAMADLYIHHGYECNPLFVGNNDAPMLRDKFKATYFAKLETALADEPIAARSQGQARDRVARRAIRPGTVFAVSELPTAQLGLSTSRMRQRRTHEGPQ